MVLTQWELGSIRKTVKQTFDVCPDSHTKDTGINGQILPALVIQTGTF